MQTDVLWEWFLWFMHLFSAGWIIVSVLAGLNKKTVRQVQLTQNSTASNTKRVELITPVLKSLQWLPVCQGIEFKMPLFVYKATKDLRPKYINLYNMKHPHPSGEVWSWLPESQTEKVKQQGEDTS